MPSSKASARQRKTTALKSVISDLIFLITLRDFALNQMKHWDTRMEQICLNPQAKVL